MAYFDDRVVQTRQGAVRGHEDRDDTLVWKAIPFAAPPTGALRWKAPRDPEPWSGVRERSEFSRLACQAVRREQRGRTSEDCLYLNVWRPATRAQGLPVYVWIHGGGNTVAVPTPAALPGTAIASCGDVIFVSIQYRLGEFGWLAHPALRTGKPGDAHDDSGNYGTLDIIAALRFIRDNIETFGGDPGKVFVTGESAGAYNTLTLLLSPAARGLFHGAMAQSGRQTQYSMDQADRHAHAVLRQMLVNDETAAGPDEAETLLEKMSEEEIAHYLRSRSFVDFLRARRSTGFIAGFRDGAVLHRDGFDAFTRGDHPNKVPIIVGMNKDEAKFQLAMGRAWERLDDDVYQAVGRHLSDLKQATGADDVLRKLAACPEQPPVYGYQMMWGHRHPDGRSAAPEPAAGRIGASHGIDIPFFFGQDSSGGPLGIVASGFTDENRAGRMALSRAMMTYAAQFAHTGSPNPQGSDLPEWRPWSNAAGGDKSLLFDVDGDRVVLEMSKAELTESGVESELQSLPKTLREQVERSVAQTGRFAA